MLSLHPCVLSLLGAEGWRREGDEGEGRREVMRMEGLEKDEQKRKRLREETAVSKEMDGKDQGMEKKIQQTKEE